jgi:hypothetical protein
MVRMFSGPSSEDGAEPPDRHPDPGRDDRLAGAMPVSHLALGFTQAEILKQQALVLG